MKRWRQEQDAARPQKVHWVAEAGLHWVAECGHRWPTAHTTIEHERVLLSSVCHHCYVLYEYGPDEAANNLPTPARAVRRAQRKRSNNG